MSKTFPAKVTNQFLYHVYLNKIHTISVENGNVRFKRYTQFHVPFHYEEDFYKYSRNLCQNYIVIIVLVTMLIIRILAPKMEKWGQDPNNEQCIYTLLIIRILAPYLFLRYWGQDPNNEQCLYNIAHYQDTCPTFLKNGNFIVSNFKQQVAENEKVHF